MRDAASRRRSRTRRKTAGSFRTSRAPLEDSSCSSTTGRHSGKGCIWATSGGIHPSRSKTDNSSVSCRSCPQANADSCRLAEPRRLALPPPPMCHRHRQARCGMREEVPRRVRHGRALLREPAVVDPYARCPGKLSTFRPQMFPDPVVPVPSRPVTSLQFAVQRSHVASHRRH